MSSTPAAAEPAGDLAGGLAAAGVPARAVPVYATEAVEALPDLGAARPEAVLLHSPKAARTLARLLPPAAAAAMTAYALSPACGAPLARLPFKAIETAAAPNEDVLLARLPPP